MVNLITSKKKVPHVSGSIQCVIVSTQVDPQSKPFEVVFDTLDSALRHVSLLEGNDGVAYAQSCFAYVEGIEQNK